MRLRRRAGTKEALLAQPDLYVENPREWRGRWHEWFGNTKPIHLELGMGKGRFISEMCGRFPDCNFIGVDMKEELLMQASDKARAVWQEKAQIAPPNLALVLFNIEYITEMFTAAEATRIYLNFSDPWPKKRHAVRRLTHPIFLEKYKQILNKNGEIHFKTDSEQLFEFSLNSLSDSGFQLRHISLHLHRDGERTDFVMTEYEQKFHDRGQPIFRVEALFPKAR